MEADKPDRRDRKRQASAGAHGRAEADRSAKPISRQGRVDAYLLWAPVPVWSLLVLAAYNVVKKRSVPHKFRNYKETQGYVKTVMGLYEVFRPEASNAVRPMASIAGRIGSRMGGRIRVELDGAPQVLADNPDYTLIHPDFFLILSTQ